MEKKKIAFVFRAYGEEMCGGGEIHIKMLAERLASQYDVEVLTSNFLTASPEAYYPLGEQQLKGVKVRRFTLTDKTTPLTHKMRQKRRLARNIRETLHKIGLLTPLSNLFPVWNFNVKNEIEVLQVTDYNIYSPQVVDYLVEHQHEYDAIITLGNGASITSVCSALAVPHKMILIPVLHWEKESFYSLNTHLFHKVAHIAFNTEAERECAYSIFGRRIAPNSIVSVGVDLSKAAPFDAVKEKYGLPDKYILYVGRIQDDKIGSIIHDFVKYKQKYGGDVKFVLVGRAQTANRKWFVESDDVILTGFVDAEEKTTIIENAMLLINPSLHESLSLLMLEGMVKQKPVLVNGKCPVLKEHCIKSGCERMYYTSQRDFSRRLTELLNDEQLREEYGRKGREYIEREYNWDDIITKLKTVIETVSQANK